MKTWMLTAAIAMGLLATAWAAPGDAPAGPAPTPADAPEATPGTDTTDATDADGPADPDAADGPVDADPDAAADTGTQAPVNGDAFITYENDPDTATSATMSDQNLISITVDNVPLQDVVRMFTKLSDANIIATASNLEGSVTVSLTDVEWRPALTSILEMHGLTLVEKSPGSGIWSIVSRSPDAEEPMHVKVIRLKYAKVDDVTPIVQTMMTGSPGTVSQFPSRNTIIIRSTSEVLEQLAAFIDQIDQARDQVYIEAKFIELNHGDASTVGIDWQMLRGYDISLSGITRSYSDARTTERDSTRSAAVTRNENREDQINERIDINGQPFEESTTEFVESPPDSGNFIANTIITPTRTITDTITDDRSTEDSAQEMISRTIEDVRAAVLSPADMRIVLSALEEMSGVAIVSNPKIIVANEEKAVIHIGESEPNIRGTVTPGQQGQANTTTYELDPTQPYFQFGIQVDVTPTVNTESNITVAITPRLTRFVRDKSAPDGNTFPVTSEKSINTEFNLENGKTAAIGGLTETTDRDTTRGIPVLGDIPLIGKYLFSHSSKERVQQETIIFVTVGLANPSDMHRDVGIPEYTRDTPRHLLRQRVQQFRDLAELEELEQAAEREMRNEGDAARDALGEDGVGADRSGWKPSGRR